MQIVNKKQLENEILQLTDKLIQCAINLEEADVLQKNTNYYMGVNAAYNLALKILTYLDGKHELLESMLNQLTKQKLPNEKTMESFKNFSKNLNLLIKEAIKMIGEHEQENTAIYEPFTVEETPDVQNIDNNLENDTVQDDPRETSDNLLIHKEEEKIDSLEKILSTIFKNQKIIKKYPIAHKVLLDYYLPEIKLGIVTDDQAITKNPWLNYKVNTENINIIAIPQKYHKNFLGVSRLLQKYKI